MLIKVTKEHIRKGKRYISNCCPVALALKDAGFDAAIGLHTIRILDGIQFVWLVTPRSVMRFINRFDQKKPVKPFNFIFKYYGD